MIGALISISLSGLLIGGLGHLLARPKLHIGLLWTVLCGIGGAVAGGIASSILYFPWGGDHWLARFALEVAAAALLVPWMARRRRSLVR